MAITVTLYSFTKRENSTKRPSSGGTNYSCVLIDDTSLMNPVFKLDLGSNPIGKNYCHVADFNRYYFITEIRSYKDFWYISCTCDVLGTYKDQIGAETHYVLRSASEYDLTISDTEYIADTQVTTYQTYAESGDPMAWTNGHSYILGIVGSTDIAVDQVGSLIYYWFDDNSLKNFIKYLSNNIDSWCNIAGEYTTGVKQALINPIQYIKSAICLPVSMPSGSAGNTSSVKFGYYSWSVPGGSTVKTISNYKTLTKETAYVTVPVHPQAETRGSYLNCAPYSYYYLHYGPWGDIELDPSMVNGNTKLKVETTYDLLTGIGRLLISGYTYQSRVFFNGSAKVGVDINLSQIYKDALGYESALTTQIFTQVSAGMQGDFGKLLGAGAAGCQNMTRLNYPVVKGVGDSGSFLAMFDTDNLYLFSKFNHIVEENLVEIGRPLCQPKQINTLSGYIMCSLADCTISGTHEEAQKVNEYLNGGFFFE